MWGFLAYPKQKSGFRKSWDKLILAGRASHSVSQGSQGPKGKPDFGGHDGVEFSFYLDGEPKWLLKLMSLMYLRSRRLLMTLPRLPEVQIRLLRRCQRLPSGSRGRLCATVSRDTRYVSTPTTPRCPITRKRPISGCGKFSENGRACSEKEPEDLRNYENPNIEVPERVWLAIAMAITHE